MGLFKLMHEGRIGQIVLASSGVDAYVPKASVVTLFLFAASKCVVSRFQ